MESTNITIKNSQTFPTVMIETHGCKLNMADSQMLAKRFTENGYSIVSINEDKSPSVFVLNSCTVTHVADRKARNALRKARRKFPDALIVAAGCYVERDETIVKELEVVDLAVNNRSKDLIVEQVNRKLKNNNFFDYKIINSVDKVELLGRSRASLKIQEGCNQVCSYCIIPKVRGRERSIPIKDLINSANYLYKQGVSEIILTGTQLGNYGFDLPELSLTKMLKSFLENTTIPRIRVSSLQPLEINEELIGIWEKSQNRLCPHFHLPLQSGSTRILKDMRRRYSKEDFLHVVGLIRTSIPDANITTDVIVGFPGERDDDHRKTLEVINNVGFSDVHIFPFSRRPGTSAWYLGEQINSSVIKNRALEIKNNSKKIRLKIMKAAVGSVRSVLWEGENQKVGLTDNYLRVYKSFGNKKKSETPIERLRPIIENTKIVRFVDGKLFAQKK